MNYRKKPIRLPIKEDRRLCYGCKHLEDEWCGDGSTFFRCGRVPGLVVGHVGAFDNDEPREADRCYERGG